MSGLAPSILTLLVATAIGAGPSGAGEHLLAGATAFREGRFAEALVEFRVAERLGAEEAGPYAGAALVKLGRPEEAVEAFGPAPAAGEDAFLTLFRALALRGAGLLLSADAALAGIGERSGPGLAKEVARLRSEIAALVEPVPTEAAIDAALARAAALRVRGRAGLAAASFREAAALAARAADVRRVELAERACAELGCLAARRAR